MKLSIIIPCYNEYDTIKKILDKINNQRAFDKEIIVIAPNIIVVPILKNVEETIAGTINNNENGLEIPPVKYNKALNCIKSYIRNKEE